jgi:carboxypeptidase PM20D1
MVQIKLMVRKILLGMGIVVLCLIAVLLFNTFRSKPWPIASNLKQLEPLPAGALQRFSEAVQIPTISISDTSGIDTVAFKRFDSFLVRSYPLVHSQLARTAVQQFSYIYKWKGVNTSLKPIILMGHYDVVPVEAAALPQWQVSPFSGAITDSCIWGRGAVDDKSGVISVLEAVESSLQKGFVPQRTIFLCFGHDEEVSGRGARATVQYLEQKGVRAEMVLDEGGEITVSKIKDVPRPVAVMGVAEKGYASFELSVKKEGGHSSKPDKETAIDILTAALYKLRSTSSAARITPPVHEFLNRIGSSSNNFVNRMASANLWAFEGITKGIISATPEGNAMLHTTIVPTILQSGIKDNVIPSTATAIVNSRILPDETAATVATTIRNAIKDERVVVKQIGQFNADPSAATSVQSPAFKRVESAVNQIIPNVIATPYLMIGATDSRYYRRIADGVVNFLPLTDSKGFHGINERLPIKDFQRGVQFFRTVSLF